jgi:hypothetical protein
MTLFPRTPQRVQLDLLTNPLLAGLFREWAPLSTYFSNAGQKEWRPFQNQMCWGHWGPPGPQRWEAPRQRDGLVTISHCSVPTSFSPYQSFQREVIEILGPPPCTLRHGHKGACSYELGKPGLSGLGRLAGGRGTCSPGPYCSPPLTPHNTRTRCWYVTSIHR